MLFLLTSLYWIGAAIAAVSYLNLWFNDQATPFSDPTSWVVLSLASLLWPLVLPISLKVELLPRWQARYGFALNLKMLDW